MCKWATRGWYLESQFSCFLKYIQGLNSIVWSEGRKVVYFSRSMWLVSINGDAKKPKGLFVILTVRALYRYSNIQYYVDQVKVLQKKNPKFGYRNRQRSLVAYTKAINSTGQTTK